MSRLSRAIQGTLADPNPPGQRLDSASRKRAAAAADGGTLRVSPDPADAFAPRRLAHLDSYSTSSPLETRDIPAPARPRGPRLTPRPPPPGPVIRQVLCDGNFLHAVSQMKLGDPKDVLAKYLGSPPKLFTTRCVQHELRGMGHEFKEASLAARRLAEVEGGPDPPAKAFDSVLAAVEGDNAERFLVCTQDEKLRVALREASPYVPVIFCHTSGLQMEPPADAEGSGVASQRETGEGLSDRERGALGQEETARDVNRIRTNVRYAKPKARGPNPLSMKKKTKKGGEGGNKPAPKADGGVKKKRKRRGGGGGGSGVGGD